MFVCVCVCVFTSFPLADSSYIPQEYSPVLSFTHINIQTKQCH